MTVTNYVKVIATCFCVRKHMYFSEKALHSAHVKQIGQVLDLVLGQQRQNIK